MFYDRILKVENFGASKTAIITLGLNATYDKIILLLSGGLDVAHLGGIRIKANDIEIFTDTCAFLNLRQAYQGVSTDAGEITIDFTEPHARGDAAQQYLASIPANLLKKLVVEVDVLAAAAGALAAAAEFRGPTSNPFILKRRVFNYFAAGAADQDLFLPSGGNGGIIKRVWLHDAGIVTKAMLRVGGFIALNYPTVAELGRVQTRNKLVPQANVDVLDFIADGNLQGALNTAAGSDVALRLTTSGAGAIQGYIDYIDPIGNLK